MCLAAMRLGSSGACLGYCDGQIRGLEPSSPSISIALCHSRLPLAFRWLYALGYHTYSVDVTPPRPLELKASCVLQTRKSVVTGFIFLQDWESTILPLLHEGKAGELETKHGISAQGLAELMAVHDSAPVPALFGCSGPGGLSPV